MTRYLFIVPVLALAACGPSPEPPAVAADPGADSAVLPADPIDADIDSSGVPDYRASGNEPGWQVTLGGGRLEVLADYGETRLSAPLPPADPVGGGRRYDTRAEGHRIEVEIQPGPCADDMTGMPHPDRVRLTLDERVLDGCGGAPLDLLTGGQWRIETIDDEAIVNPSRATLVFADDGRASGNASCNGYDATFRITGEGVSFAPIATTMMACDEQLMIQEHRVLDALAAVTRFQIADDGALVLHEGDTPRLLARREPGEP